MKKDACSPLPVIYTDKAQCHDCYRCVRLCPVKAIRIQNGQACVDEKKCIYCGTCVRNCPQQAKKYRIDIESVREILQAATPVAASVAPSYPALYSGWRAKRLPSALRRLGFHAVAETAVGAQLVAEKYGEHVKTYPNNPWVATACPAVVNYVERYLPDKIPTLLPVVSPMIAHARILKQTLGPRCRIVFIGPCIAKKMEASRPEYRGLVDAVLTFEELEEWLAQENVDLASCEDSEFDNPPVGDASLFPLAAGAMKTARLDTSGLNENILFTSGFDSLQDSLLFLDHPANRLLIEPLFCSQGCINGPATACTDNVYQRRQSVLRHASQTHSENTPQADIPWKTEFLPSPCNKSQRFTEEMIRKVLARTGKESVEKQLNCGACGYASCHDQAIAVLRGMAEPEMCMPYMRLLAERRTDKIIETSPNGIVILDHEMRILSMNQSFRKFFQCSDSLIGRRVSEIMDPEPFEQLACGAEQLDETIRLPNYHLIARRILYALPEDRQYVGIFVNLTSGQNDKRKLDELRAQTLLQAQELLQHQMEMAKKMAVFLGENAAKGELLVDHLMKLAEESDDTSV